MASNTAVFGIYFSRVAVERAIEALTEAGFRPTDVSVLMSHNLGNKDLVTRRATKAPEGASAGAATGAVVGGALGLLVGLGALAIPGLGPFIAAGPIVAALAGVGVGGTVGGIAGALAGLGMPEYEAKRYEGRVLKGGILVSVHCDDARWRKKAESLLDQTGAVEISATGESRAQFQSTDRTVPR